jgi:hypothetical protein
MYATQLLLLGVLERLKHFVCLKVKRLRAVCRAQYLDLRRGRETFHNEPPDILITQCNCIDVREEDAVDRACREHGGNAKCKQHNSPNTWKEQTTWQTKL